MGAVTGEQAEAVATLKSIDVTGYDFSLVPSELLHIRDTHGGPGERQRGQEPVRSDDFRHLPAIVTSPDLRSDAAFSVSGREPQARFEKVIGGRRYFAVFAARKGRRTLALKTFYIRQER